MSDALYSRLRSDIRLSLKSAQTGQKYERELRRFLAHYPGRAIETLGEAEVRGYLHDLMDVRGVGAHSYRMAVAGLKFVFARTLGRPVEVERIPWPKVKDRLPVVFADADLVALFATAERPLIYTACHCAYGAGLRVSEVAQLGIADVDSRRGVLRVAEGKTAERLTVLPPRLLANLREYWCAARPRGPWLFPAATKTGHVHARRLEEGFARALRAAGLARRGLRFHSLRHTFATHMLEAKVDACVVQALLGHRRIATTMRYAQVRADLIAGLPDLLARLGGRTPPER